MKNFLKLGIAVLLALAVLGPASAQRGNRGQQRQTRMAGNIVENALASVSAESDPLQLVFRKDVQHDLQMDLGQRNKFDNLHDKEINELEQTRAQNLRNPVAVTDLQKAQKKETQDKIDQLLSKAQKARLKQIAFQMEGYFGVVRPEIQKELAITDDQKIQIEQIKAGYDGRLRQLPGEVANRSVTLQDLTIEVQQIRKESNSALGGVLTDEQKQALQKLWGPTFKVGD